MQKQMDTGMRSFRSCVVGGGRRLAYQNLPRSMKRLSSVKSIEVLKDCGNFQRVKSRCIERQAVRKPEIWSEGESGCC